MNGITLPTSADSALSKLQNTTLSPMEEALFQVWAKANQIKKTDLPNDMVDYRGVYQMTGGKILPNGQLKRMAEAANDQYKLETVLRERMKQHVDQLAQQKMGELDAAAQARDAVNQPGAEPASGPSKMGFGQ